MLQVMNSAGDKLIFLISQPRAGSTLLQRMLGSHSDIHTSAEPWVMLAPCFSLKSEGHWAEYEAGGWARLARESFLKDIGGRDIHVKGIRSMAEVIYQAALRDSGKSRFLDKTPRYYTIVDELMQIFPNAQFVILLRNPLAVICSIIRTWIDDKWYRMPRYRDDLMKAPGLLSDAIQRFDERLVLTRYEELVQDPENELKKLCDRIGVGYEPGMLDYRSAGDDFAFGDPSGVKQHDKPVPDHLDRWLEDVKTPAVWRLAGDYLEFLKKEVPGMLGYDAVTLRSQLDENRPNRLAVAASRSLKDVMRSDDLVPGLE